MLGIGLSLRAGSPSGPPTHVFLLAGQSNMIGRATFDGGAGYPPGTLQVARTGKLAGGMDGELVAAAPMLDHHNPAAGEMGPTIAFAIAYAAANPGVGLVFVPCASGGTAFSTDHWNPGDPLYADAVARTNALLAANPGFALKGILWHQGESDATSAATANAYQGRLDAMVAGLRGAIAGAAGVPFVCGNILDGGDTVATVNAALSGVGELLDHAACASAAGLAGIVGDDRHFDAPSLRTLGARYYAAWLAAVADTPAGPTVPGQVAGLALTSAPTSIAATWSAPAANGSAITDYVVEVRQGSGAWSTFADGTSSATSATVTGLSPSTAYGVRVAAVNAIGTGAASVEATATTTAAATVPGQVTGFSVTPGNGQNGLAWSAPANGGSAIIDYVIEVTTDGGSSWSTVADGTATATFYGHTGLVNGTTYGYRVAAVNAVGAGTASATAFGTPAASGPAVTGVSHFESGSVAATTSFGFPAVAVTGGTAIVSVVARNGGGHSAVTVDGVAATKLGEGPDPDTDGLGHRVSFWLATGVAASATIAVTLAAGATRCGGVAWSVAGVTGASPFAFAAAGVGAGGTSVGASVAVPANGLLLAHGGGVAAGNAVSWSGVAHPADWSGGDVSPQFFHAAGQAAVTGAETCTVTATFGVAPTSVRWLGLLAAG